MMAGHRFGRRRLARHLLLDWALALAITALVVLALMLAACAPAPGGATPSAPATLPGVGADGSETGWWAPLGVEPDGTAQPLDIAPPLADGDRSSPSTPAPVPARLVLPADLLFFRTDSAAIGPDGGALLDQVARWLADTGATVAVVGHTDATGTDAYNLTLGQARADAVADALGQRGVPSGQLVATTSQGERCPVASNDDGAGRARNRRVELVLEAAGADPASCPTPPATGAADVTERR